MGKIGIAEIMLVILIPLLILSILLIVSYWKLYEKAGKPGWAVLVPVYSHLVLLEIVRKPWWWLLLMLIPVVNIVFAIWTTNLFVKSFGKDEGYTVGVLLLPYIFLPILAFNKETRYVYANTNEINEIGNNKY